MNTKTNRNKPIEEETIPITDTLEPNAKSVIKNKQLSRLKAQPIKEKTTPIDADEPITAKSSTELVLSQSYWSKLFWAFTLFSFSWLFYTTLMAVVEAWKANLWLGVPLATISVIFIITLIILIKRERAAFNRVDESRLHQLKINTYIENNSIIGIHNALKPRLTKIKKLYPHEYSLFENARSNRNSAAEYISLINNILLSKLDKDADDAIKKASLSIAALVAISPHPALDAFIVLIRANMLIRKISHIYGLEPTGLSALYLLKHSIISAITAASIEEISTMLLEEISAGLTEKASKLIAEGIVSSTRLYRLGHLTKKITRPLSKPSQNLSEQYGKRN